MEKLEQLLNTKAPNTTLAFVGDGINDAPVLRRADVGIAMGSLGSDAAIEAADVVLMKSRLSDVPAAIRLSRAALRNIHENLFWAFFYSSLFPMSGRCIPKCRKQWIWLTVLSRKT